MYTYINIYILDGILDRIKGKRVFMDTYSLYHCYNHIYLYIHMNIHVYVYIYICIYIHMCIHKIKGGYYDSSDDLHLQSIL
jgi:hypothetical protein